MEINENTQEIKRSIADTAVRNIPIAKLFPLFDDKADTTVLKTPTGKPIYAKGTISNSVDRCTHKAATCKLESVPLHMSAGPSVI